MRIVLAAALGLGFAPQSADAATAAGRFSVSVVVEASCSIAVSALVADLRSSGAPKAPICSPTPALTRVAAPTPTVRIAPDSVTGRPTMTVEF